MQGELWGLGLEEFTIGEMFQEYGYKTHAIGMQNIPQILKTRLYLAHFDLKIFPSNI